MSVRVRPLRPLAALTVLALTSVAATAVSAPYFQEITTPYGVQGCSGTKQGCWTNYMQMTDIDGDGDLDILYPNADGYFSKGSVQPFSVYLNDGTGKFTSGAQTIVNGYIGYVRQMAIGDSTTAPASSSRRPRGSSRAGPERSRSISISSTLTGTSISTS